MDPLEIVVLDSLEPWDATARNKALQALSVAPVVAREGGGRSTASELVSPRRLEPRRVVSANIGRNLEDLVVAYIASVGQELLRVQSGNSTRRRHQPTVTPTRRPRLPPTPSFSRAPWPTSSSATPCTWPSGRKVRGSS